METKTLDDLEDDDLRDYLLPFLILYGVGRTIKDTKALTQNDALYFRAWSQGYLLYNQITTKGMSFIEAIEDANNPSR